MAAHADGAMHLTYELHVTNISTKERAISRFEVLGAGVDLLLQPGDDPERAVEELGGEGAVSPRELGSALDLGLVLRLCCGGGGERCLEAALELEPLGALARESRQSSGESQVAFLRISTFDTSRSQLMISFFVARARCQSATDVPRMRQLP